MLDLSSFIKSKKPAKETTADEEIKIEEAQSDTKVTTTVDSGDFPSFDEFVDGLGSWKDALKGEWSQKYFKDIYEFLKKEYSTKTVYFLAGMTQIRSIHL